MEKKEEFKEKVLYINRCSKVVKGGRTFSFSALVIVGDENGKIGCGFAKANEVSDAVKKASESAKKDVFTFEMDGTTIPHEIISSYDGAKMLLKPAKKGTGVIAGSKARFVLELAGIKDIVAKSIGANNPINIVKATIEGLKKQRNRKKMMEERNVSTA